LAIPVLLVIGLLVWVVVNMVKSNQQENGPQGTAESTSEIRKSTSEAEFRHDEATSREHERHFG
jgi:cytoskeletal protein RodZ